MTSEIQLGIYKHYKGGLYVALCGATHSETKEQLVIYQNIEHGTIYARPLEMFFEDVTLETGKEPRFKFIRDDV